MFDFVLLYSLHYSSIGLSEPRSHGITHTHTKYAQASIVNGMLMWFSNKFQTVHYATGFQVHVISIGFTFFQMAPNIHQQQR